MADTITYGLERLETGARRWGITRNGEVIHVKRTRNGAEGLRQHWQDYLGIMGEESGLAMYYAAQATRLATRTYAGEAAR